MHGEKRGGRLPALGIYVTAPVEYDARDFLVHLYITLCKTVLADDRFTDHRARSTVLCGAQRLSSPWLQPGPAPTITTPWTAR